MSVNLFLTRPVHSGGVAREATHQELTQMTTTSQLNALAAVALTGDFFKATTWNTKWALLGARLVDHTPLDVDAVGAGTFRPYHLTDAGRATLDRSPTWRAAEFLQAQGYELDRTRYLKPGFLPFRRVGTIGRRSADTAWISGGRDAWIYVPVAEPRYDGHCEARQVFPDRQRRAA